MVVFPIINGSLCPHLCFGVYHLCATHKHSILQVTWTLRSIAITYTMCMLNFKYKSGDEIVQGPEGASLFRLFRCPSNSTFHMGFECPSTTIRLACDIFSRNLIHFNPKQEALHSISSCWSMYNLCTRIWNPTRGNIQKWSSADFIVRYSTHSWLPCGSSDLL